jgi:hypothetical protein
VRLWNRTMQPNEILNLYLSDSVPINGLVAEFLLNADTGNTAIDTAKGNDGVLVNALWATQG